MRSARAARVATSAAAATCWLASRRHALSEAAPQAAAPKWRSLAQDDSAAAAFAQRRPFVAGVSIKELQPGTGEHAELGMWVAVHYTIRLVGDGSVLVDTRTSGYGDRDYGCPEEFTLGQLQDESVLRALHACVIDMHTGGRRRVRTSLSDPDFGYRELPIIRDDKFHKRWLVGDWLMDVEVSLESVRPERPGRWERVVRFWDGR